MAVPLDRRTRFDTDLRPLTPEQFFTEVFPALAERHGPLMAAGIRALAPPPLSVEVGDETWSLVADGDSVVAREGMVDGALVITLEPPAFSDWAQQHQSLNGMGVAQALVHRNGTERDISIWDSLTLTMLEGWPIVDDELAFVDRHGDPLDLGQSFTRDDDPADVAHFLREAGYLHLRGWLDPADMATISDDIDRAVPAYEFGDGKSWWAILDDDSWRCVRLQDFLPHSPTTAAMLEGDVWEQLRRTIAAHDDLIHAKSIEALIKPVGVVKGASDVTFHRDCHLGRHPYTCSGTTIGVAITGGNEANGRLRVAAGSHRVVMPVEVAKVDPYLPIVAVSTEPGDLTVHLSCTLHEAAPPKHEERKVMYAAFGLAPRDGDLPEGSLALSELREAASKILLTDSAPSAAEIWSASTS